MLGSAAGRNIYEAIVARYRKIDTRIWGDARFRQLSKPKPNAQTLWFYLLTNRHTTSIPGLYGINIPTIAHELGWEIGSANECVREIIDAGLVRFDTEAGLIWIKNAIKYSPPESPNVVRSWRVSWDELPECPLKINAWHMLKAFLEGFSKAFAEAFAEGLPEAPSEYGAVRLKYPSANQEQEQEQEQEQDKDICVSEKKTTQALTETSRAKARRSVSSEIQTVWTAYREYHPRLPGTLKSNRKEYRLVKARLEDFSTADLIQAIHGYHASPFHNGDNDKGRKYLNLQLICRDIEHVARGIEMAEQPERTKSDNRKGVEIFLNNIGAENHERCSDPGTEFWLANDGTTGLLPGE